MAEVQLLPDKTVFIQLALFLALFAGLHFLIFKPVLRILKERLARTEGDRKKIGELALKTEALMQDYEARIAKAREEAAVVKEGIRKEGADQAAKLVHEAKQLRLAELEKIRAEVAKASSDAEKKLVEESQLLGGMLADKVAGRKL